MPKNAVCSLIAIALLAAAPATAAQPRRGITVDPATGRVGGVGLGAPILAFSQAWGPPDEISFVNGEPTAMWRDRHDVVWAAVRFDATQEHAIGFVYGGAFGTKRGDRVGERLPLLTARWPAHGPKRTIGHPRGYDVRVASVVFRFDAAQRLNAVWAGRRPFS